MSNKIDKFENEYAFLSNFYLCRIEIDGLIFDSTEAAYQASKSKSLEVRKKFIGLNASQAKKLGRQIALRDDWEDVKIEIMERILREKFSNKNPELLRKLVDTEDDVLIESNWWNDTFWGICRGIGENNLGKLLMKIREELKEGK